MPRKALAAPPSPLPSDRRSFLRRSAVGLAAGALALEASAEDLPEASPSQRFLNAVAAGEADTVEALLHRDPGLLHVRDRDGRSAYSVALLAGHAGVAARLVESGYESDAHEAAFTGDWERFAELAGVNPASLDRHHPLAGTAMAAAARGGAGRQIWRVYRYGGSPNSRPRGDRDATPLRLALDHPDPLTAELTATALLGNGADPNLPQPDGVSPLHRAAARGLLDLTEMFVRRGAEEDLRDPAGRTARDLAAEAGHSEVEALLGRHRQIPRDCFTSRYSRTLDGKPYRPAALGAISLLAIQELVGLAHFDRAQVMRRVTDLPRLAHAVGLTTEGAVEAAAHMGNVPLVDDLLAHGAPYSLPTAVMRGDTDTVRELLEEDPRRIHERGAHDFALLWYPVIGGGLLEMAKLLLDRGADPEKQHHMGTTALHWAARAGQLEMVELLCERGADPERIGRQFDTTGQTPTQMALEKDHIEVARWLRERGARA